MEEFSHKKAQKSMPAVVNAAFPKNAARQPGQPTGSPVRDYDHVSFLVSGLHIPVSLGDLVQ